MFDVDCTALKIDSNIVIVASELLEHLRCLPRRDPREQAASFCRVISIILCRLHDDLHARNDVSSLSVPAEIDLPIILALLAFLRDNAVYEKPGYQVVEIGLPPQEKRKRSFSASARDRRLGDFSRRGLSDRNRFRNTGGPACLI
jgi:hypothetical protein